MSTEKLTIEQWAAKHRLPPQAMLELREMSGMFDNYTKSGSNTPESTVQIGTRVEASDKGGLLMRNNVGALKTENGRLIRYGLANESREMNQLNKSSDLIGIMPVVVTPAMVGTTVGIFTARECKRSNWMYAGTDTEKAQLNFINIINSLGGNARFANKVGTL